MAIAEASSNVHGSGSSKEGLENGGGSSGRDSANGGEGHGMEMETVKEGNGLSPRMVSVFESRYSRRNVSARSMGAREVRKVEGSNRDGFPRGFSIGSSTSGLRKIVKDDAIGEKSVSEEKRRYGERVEPVINSGNSSGSIIMDFDVEEMSGVIVDESPVFGSRAELTPEIRSFRESPSNRNKAGYGNYGEEAQLNISLSSATIKKDDHKRHIFSKRKKSTSEKVAPVVGLPIRNTPDDAKCDGHTTLHPFAKPVANRDEHLSNYSTPLDPRDQLRNLEDVVGSFEITFDDVGDLHGWNNVHPRGEKPVPRQFHAAAVVGRRMVVVGGQTELGSSNDVQMLHLGKMTWSELGRERTIAEGHARNVKAATPGSVPRCRGHSLVSWGKTVLLVGGELNPASDRVEVWSFDVESECWTKVVTKGEIPAARNGQSVTRAGSILIMFGGETPKGQKLNDLHILDLKSLMWLPLYTLGTGPSPRTKHCAAMYDDRFLLIFGGASKSKPLGDLCALDFETMEWSKLKTKGVVPSPRSGHAGVLVGDKWYIAGGETRDYGSTETLMLDVTKLTWSTVAATVPNTTVTNQGLSLVLVQRKEKTMLVAFGGKGLRLSSQVQVLYISPMNHVKPSSYNSISAKSPSMARSGLSCACVGVAKTQSSPLAEEQYVSRVSPGNSPLTESSLNSADIVPSRRRYSIKKDGTRQPPGEILSRVLRETPLHEIPSPLLYSCKVPDAPPPDLEMRDTLAPIPMRSSEITRYGSSSRRKGSFDSTLLLSVNESTTCVDSSRRASWLNADLSIRTRSYASDRSEYSLYTAPQSQRWEGEEECSDSQLLADLQDAMTMEKRIHLINKYRQSFEMKLAAAVRRGEQAEGQLTTALRGKEEAENRLASALQTRQQTEAKLAVALKKQADLKEAVAAAERSKEDSNNLCNLVHSENLRLEHDLAFLKAVLEDTHKELDSTREALAMERAKSSQLQMEVLSLSKRSPLSVLTEEETPISQHPQWLPLSEIR